MVMDVYQYGLLLLTEKKLASGHQLLAGVSFIPYGRAPVIFEVVSDDHVHVFSEVSRFFSSNGIYKSDNLVMTVVNLQTKWTVDEISDMVSLSLHERSMKKKDYSKYTESFVNSILGMTRIGRSAVHPRNIELGRCWHGRVALVIQIETSHDVDEILPFSVFDSTSKLVLENTAIEQLELEAVIKVIDHTSTSMGKRLLSERIFMPWTNPEDIKRMHMAVHEHTTLVDDMHRILEDINDIDRIGKQMVTGTIAPGSLGGAVVTFNAITKLYELFGRSCVLSRVVIDTQRVFDISKLKGQKPTKEMFKQSLRMNTCAPWLQHDFEHAVREIVSDHSIAWSAISSFVAEKDLIKSMILCMNKKKWVLPTIVDTGLSAVAMRHPLIESHTSKEPCIPNDVDLGQMVLNAYNGTGKSSYMKMVAVNIVLAQAGYPVPAQSFKLRPLHKVFTLLNPRDQITKGLSTFELDALEINSVIHRANSDSLVIADELFTSSDHITNTTMAYGALQILLANDVKFIIATHNRTLLDRVDDVLLWHMMVSRTNGLMIYDRTLVRGRQPDEAYGLEIAKGMGLDPKLFAYTMVSSPKKTSRYNKALLVDTCEVCGQDATETHHIIFQKDAKDGFIDHRKVHALSNLVPLCDDCHTRVHLKTLTIHGYKKTNEGVQLIYEA